jgi:hypothetical protein
VRKGERERGEKRERERGEKREREREREEGSGRIEGGKGRAGAKK